MLASNSSQLGFSSCRVCSSLHCCPRNRWFARPLLSRPSNAHHHQGNLNAVAWTLQEAVSSCFALSLHRLSNFHSGFALFCEGSFSSNISRAFESRPIMNWTKLLPTSLWRLSKNFDQLRERELPSTDLSQQLSPFPACARS